MAASYCRLNCHGCWLIPLHLILAASVLRAGAGAGHGVGDVGFTAATSASLTPQSSTGRRTPIVHQHSQYSPLADKDGLLAHMEILSMDQRRVVNIHRRVSETSGGRVKQKHGVSSRIQQQQLQSGNASDFSPGPSTPSEGSNIMNASSGSEMKTGNYVMAIHLGTPSERYTVALDTGSNVAWVQCKPCTKYCHGQAEPLFSPANSSTFAYVPCKSSNCSSISSANCSRDGHCAYDIHYNDYSYTQGDYSQDTLFLGHDTFPDFRFGCSSMNTWGLFGRTAGVMGLGRGSNSLTMQAYYKYKGVFAYCLPADATGTGFLHLGPGAAPAPANASQTPMLTNIGPKFYYVALTGIMVGGHPLPIKGSIFSNSHTLIDTGTVITRLPPSAYRQLRLKFAEYMGVLGYIKAPGFSVFDTCFNLTGLQGIIPVPTVSLVFGGGVTLEVDSSGILYAVNVSQACLAFMANGKDTQRSIIGSTQQKTYNVWYDVGNKLVGFTPGAC